MSKSKFEFTGDKQYNIFNICEHRSSKIKQKEIKSLSGDYPIYGASGEIKKVDYFDVDKEYIAIVKDGAGAGRVMLLPKNSSVISTMMYIIPNNDLIETKYLYYLLKSMNLENLTTGATIPHLYFKNFKNKMVILPSLVVQQNISLLFEKIEIIINSHINLLELYDKTIRGRFVEMFGNPLEITKESRYMKEFLTINPLKRELSDKEDIMVSFVPMENVGEDGSFSIKEEGPISNYNKGYTYFKDGDVLLAKITPCFENGKIAIAKNCKNGVGFGSTEFHVFRCDNRLCDPVWVKYLLKNEHVHEYAKINMTGSAGQKRIQKSFFENLRTILPNLDVQNQFADFVRQIDKSKVAVQASLDKTQMLFDSLMQEYFG